MSDTLLKPKVIQSIHEQIHKNMRAAGQQKRLGPNPTNHPITIHQRGLKRHFKDLLQKCENIAADGGQALPKGRVPKNDLIAGYKEYLKLQGREHAISNLPASFFEDLLRRVPADTTSLDWESFMILVMIEDVALVTTVIESLRRVFSQFDLRGNGYVEFRELRDMIAAVRGAPPAEAELNAKLDYFGADMSMTLSWDEFLLLMYDHGAALNEKVDSVTPLTPSPPQIHH